MKKIFYYILLVLFVACDNSNKEKTNHVEDEYSRLERIDQKTNRASNLEGILKAMTSPIIVISSKLKIQDSIKRISIVYKNVSQMTITLINFECFGNDINGFRSVIEETPESNHELQFLKPNETGEVSFYIDKENEFKQLTEISSYPTSIFFEDGKTWMLNKFINK